MKTVLALTAAILAVGCAHGGTSAATQAAQNEADLAKALSGRVAGPPQECVDLRELGGNKSYGRDVIVFSGGLDDVVWVNRPPAGCNGLDFGRALKTLTTTTRLCRGDIVTVYDPSSGTEFGGCGLGDFTPYRRSP